MLVNFVHLGSDAQQSTTKSELNKIIASERSAKDTKYTKKGTLLVVCTVCVNLLSYKK